jgi:hypothetical protein
VIIKLTLASTRTPIGLRAGDIKQVTKDIENPLVTAVWTGLMTQQGPQAFAVLESIEKVIELANSAWDRMRGVGGENPLPGEKHILG